MGEAEKEFLKEHFRSFYEKNELPGVPELNAREFGIGDFGKKIVKRHMHFSNATEMNNFLKRSVPPYISYSAAYYQSAAARPMEAKGFMGADLIYEFDADDIPTKCKEEHDYWKCSSAECGAEGKGALQACPKCGSGVTVKQWFCSECLGETKKQTVRLLEVLSGELGFGDGISINFSGKAGYHIHVRSNAARKLSKPARNELIDYLTLNGFSLEAHGFGRPKQSMLTCPIPSKSRGLTKRFMQRLSSFISNWNPEKLAVHGNIKRKQSKFLVENREIILKKMERGILFPIPAARPDTSKKFWTLLIDEAMREESISLKIDRQTSVDVHKILRLPGSIHGGTGLIAKMLSFEEFKEFDPFVDALAFEGEPVRVFINKSPKFSLGGESFQAFTETEQVLPLNAAIYLIASGRAVLG